MQANTYTLDVCILQTHLFWEDIDANIELFTRLIAQAPPAQLYVLPEMFTTAFSIHPHKLASSSQQKGVEWMHTMAKQKNAAIVGSLMVQEGDKYYNRLYFVTPQQEYTYNKRHLFGVGNEDKNYTKGNKLLIVEYLGWKICPLICYDLRFPVWSRNTHGYDILLYVANWPQKRIYQWRSLLIARAIENQSYVLACNRTGHDGNELQYNGNSAIVNYDGFVVSETIQNTDYVCHTLSKQQLIEYRNLLPFLNDSDTFSIN